ncbi:17-beta-hydroxysteroid dehydrogenase 13-like [Topomyia yanbarensis]|uniref:17-beta-hydroxysteroid dehydrogenase 13-like n=1 Tax=Topomyia yanbarensis TaxID=2498891 RepID=UPI00273CD4A6|nr:17-beta-hydroxysteroid dehydrogenase 13-like [Topomyia yanbarensis]
MSRIERILYISFIGILFVVLFIYYNFILFLVWIIVIDFHSLGLRVVSLSLNSYRQLREEAASDRMVEIDSETSFHLLPKSKQVLNIAVQVLLVLIDLIKVVIVGLPILVREFINVVIPKKLKNVSGQLALVTGGGNGLGREIALLLADKGCNIVVVDIDMRSAERTCDELRSKNVKAFAYQVDVSSFGEVQALFSKVYGDIGPVDILINNAGLIHFTFLQDSSEDDINKLIDVNVKSYIWTTKVALTKMMEQKRGHIVAISSICGIYPHPWAVVYTASKHAVNGLMGALHEQLRLQGYADHIRTTCVCPYYIATRQDVVDFLKKPRFKLLTTAYTARVIVDGILRNEHNVAVPPFFDLGIKLMHLFPMKIQHLVRDYIVREYELNSM